ncbi:hypothetical protein [Geminocystis sp. NIES-3709]|uniref:hypothetical protein n=1 Tax=Geminocystis sp. NIES-3709 TaxID=1617448 RepID=UPI0005FC72D3|nr:hypothetical protein [Geminocystis sp. NIES-3709]BAQ64601.1 hypothetical protein GM3709_1366 [Geminocystis sp. NIES-3709]
MYTPKNKEIKCTLYDKSGKIKNSMSNKNEDNQVDKEALEIFERVYKKYEYVFQELAK